MIAVNDGVVKKIGRNDRLGRYIVLQDVYGNRYTYAHLGKVSERYPVPRRSQSGAARDEFRAARRTSPRTCPSRRLRRARPSGERRAPGGAPSSASASARAPEKERLFANPTARATARSPQRPARPTRSRLRLRGLPGLLLASSASSRRGQAEDRSKVAPGRRRHGPRSHRQAQRGPRREARARTSTSRSGPRAAAPRGSTPSRSSTAGSCSRRRPSTARPARTRSSAVPTAEIGQVLLMSKEALARRVLADPRHRHLRLRPPRRPRGQVDRRVLATLEFLAASGLRPTSPR